MVTQTGVTHEHTLSASETPHLLCFQRCAQQLLSGSSPSPFQLLLTSHHARFGDVYKRQAYTVGANPLLVFAPTNLSTYSEPAAPLGNAVAVSDVWIELSYLSLIHILLI